MTPSEHIPGQHARVTALAAATAQLRGPGGVQRRAGDLVVIDDDHGTIRVVVEGTSAEQDLCITRARRVGTALLWRNDAGETLAVTGTVRPMREALQDAATPAATAPWQPRRPAPGA